jgi:heterodisulfide reductase subunit C
MSVDVHESADDVRLATAVKAVTEKSVANCYQCGKCSAGCPLSSEMDYPPSQILRLLQLGMPEFDEKALRSHSIWLCLTCEMCVARCPKEVDLPKVMEFLREESFRRGMVNPKAKDILAFHKAFLDAIRHTGRLYEVGLISSVPSVPGPHRGPEAPLPGKTEVPPASHRRA